MSERMSTRRERKQTEKAEAATEEKAAAPPKEKVEKVERRQSAGACVDMWASVQLRTPASCVLCVPRAQGSLPLRGHALYVCRARASLGRAVTCCHTACCGTPGGSKRERER